MGYCRFRILYLPLPSSGQPRADLFGAVRRGIVEHDMEVTVGIRAHDFLHEPEIVRGRGVALNWCVTRPVATSKAHTGHAKGSLCHPQHRSRN
jgi:hypothetical protein